MTTDEDLIKQARVLADRAYEVASPEQGVNFHAAIDLIDMVRALVDALQMRLDEAQDQADEAKWADTYD